jgi:hypothetical protein
VSFIKMMDEVNSASSVHTLAWTLHYIHLHFGHPGEKRARLIAVARINICKQELPPCTTCDCGKRTWPRISKDQFLTPHVQGTQCIVKSSPSELQCIGGKVYSVSFINSHPRHASMTLLKLKSNTAIAFNQAPQVALPWKEIQRERECLKEGGWAEDILKESDGKESRLSLSLALL